MACLGTDIVNLINAQCKCCIISFDSFPFVKGFPELGTKTQHGDVCNERLISMLHFEQWFADESNALLLIILGLLPSIVS